MDFSRISLIFSLAISILAVALVRSSSQICRDVATKIESTYYKRGYQSTVRNFSTIPSPFSVQEVARTERAIYTEVQTNFHKNSTSIDPTEVLEYLKDYEESALVLHPSFQSDEYLRAVAGNLVSVYRMVRRFRHFIQPWAFPLKKESGDELISKLKRIYNVTKTLSRTDLHLAMLAFPLLQFKFDIKAEQIAAGIYGGRDTGVTMKAIHCLEIGLHSFVSGFYPIGIEWIEHALAKVKQGDGTANESLVTNYLEKATAKHDAIWQPFNDPDMERTFFEKPLNETDGTITRKWQRELSNKTFRPDRNWPLREYDGVCKGDIKRPQKSTSKLTCWHETSIHPSWKIGPLKVELLTPLPDQVLQFHDIVRDKLTQELKNAMESKFQTAMLSSWKGNNPKMLNGGTMQKLPESPELHAKLEKLTHRVTGLRITTDSITHFQPASYGPGGFTALHHDWLTGPIQSERLATFIIYLKGPELGGGTGFPGLDFAAPALKGSAIIWFNVNSAGMWPTKTFHGSCPVVFGHKWIALKWIQYIQQDHLMCDKDPNAGVDYLTNGRAFI